MTQEFKEQATGATGDRVDRICEQPARADHGASSSKLIAVGATEVDGERATVRTRLDIDGVKAPRVFQLDEGRRGLEARLRIGRLR